MCPLCCPFGLSHLFSDLCPAQHFALLLPCYDMSFISGSGCGLRCCWLPHKGVSFPGAQEEGQSLDAYRPPPRTITTTTTRGYEQKIAASFAFSRSCWEDHLVIIVFLPSRAVFLFGFVCCSVKWLGLWWAVLHV